jgi:hypothetical protein
MSSEHPPTFKSSQHAPVLLVTVDAATSGNALVTFTFPGSQSQVKRFHVLDWTPKHDDIAGTLEAAAAEIRRLREARKNQGEKS